MQKVVLITALDPKNIYSRLGVNIGLFYLEAYARKAAEVYIVERPEEAVLLKPDMVGISSVTENYGRAVLMAGRIKEKINVPVIIGGVHISALPESLDPVFDAGVMGEGEETFLELIGAYPDIASVRGLVVWRDGRPSLTGMRPMIQNLDTLPLPDWKRWVERPGIPYVMTSRGCPYKCSFCSSPLHWGGLRVFSPARVVKEVRSLVENFDVKFVRFFDDVFTLNKKRLKEIVGLINKEGLNKKTAFGCFSRVDMIDREVVSLLKKGNIPFVFVGIESASRLVLSSLKHKAPRLSESQHVIDMLYNAGLYVGSSFIIGSPEEREADLLKTLKFVEKNKKKLFEIEINPYVIRPGTKFWRTAEKNGLVGNKMDWELLKDYSFLPYFDPDRYIYINKHIPYKRFLNYIERFKGLFDEIVFDKRKLDLMAEFVRPEEAQAKLKGLALSS